MNKIKDDQLKHRLIYKYTKETFTKLEIAAITWISLAGIVLVNSLPDETLKMKDSISATVHSLVAALIFYLVIDIYQKAEKNSENIIELRRVTIIWRNTLRSMFKQFKKECEAHGQHPDIANADTFFKLQKNFPTGYQLQTNIKQIMEMGAKEGKLEFRYSSIDETCKLRFDDFKRRVSQLERLCMSLNLHAEAPDVYERMYSLKELNSSSFNIKRRNPDPRITPDGISLNDLQMLVDQYDRIIKLMNQKWDTKIEKTLEGHLHN